MARKNFADVLKEGKIDIWDEYLKLYNIFYIEGRSGLRSACEGYFLNYSFRGLCLSLDEFEYKYNFKFSNSKCGFDIDRFIRFCEFTYNLVVNYKPPTKYYHNLRRLYLDQIDIIIEKIGYIKWRDKDVDVTILVPKDSSAIAVAEIIDSSVSYKTIEYNHHSMKGDLVRKRDTLLKYSDLLEARRQELKAVSSSLEQSVFSLFNNINIRHNNSDPQSGKYHKFVANMSNAELEKWYDETYQLCLLCFLEMDNVERKRKIKELNENIKTADQTP